MLHIYQNQKFLTDFYTEDSLTQREWVLYESTRRYVRPYPSAEVPHASDQGTNPDADLPNTGWPASSRSWKRF